MSRSSFSKAYEEITNLEPMEMTFTVEDADLDKLNDVLKDINVKECPWFEVQDKHGNKARYYREPQWIPCSEKMPKEDEEVLITFSKNMAVGCFCEYGWYVVSGGEWYTSCTEDEEQPIAWMPLPEPYQPKEEK